MSWEIRSATLQDVPAILEVVTASDLAATGEPDWTVEEIVATLTAPNHESWLAVEPDGTAVGWAYLDNPTKADRDSVEVYGEPAQRELLALAVERAAARGAQSVRAGVIPSEVSYVTELERAGFHFVKRHARMRRRLTGDERAPTGLGVRPLRPDDEAERRAFHRVMELAFADHPDYQPVSYPAWSARIGARPEVCWDEWFVATVDGHVVGALESSQQAVEHDEGWVKNLAVRREYRRRGLGAGLLMAAFAAYAAKGRRWAGLGVDLTNPTGAYHLYTSIGMAPTFEADVYELVLRLGGSGA